MKFLHGRTRSRGVRGGTTTLRLPEPLMWGQLPPSCDGSLEPCNSTGVTSTPIALVYARVSTGQQADSGLSLDSQEREVITRAEADGYTVEVIREEGRSGKNMTGRPLLTAALHRLDAGDAQALYVSKLDRLARSARDALDMRHRAEVNDWRLVITTTGADTGTPAGRMMFTMLAGVAEMELDLIRERHAAWHAEAWERGKRWGVDYGPRSEIDPEVEARILAARDAGDTYTAIADRLNSEDVPTARGGSWHPTTVRKVVKRAERVNATERPRPTHRRRKRVNT